MSVTSARAQKRRALEALAVLGLVAYATWQLKPEASISVQTPPPAGIARAGPGLWERFREANLLKAVNDRELERLNRQLASDPDNVDALYRRSLIHRLHQDAEAELNDLDRILELRPDTSPSARNHRAWTLAHLGRYHQATLDVEQAAGLVDWTPTEAYVMIGTGKNEEVLPILEGWLMVSPNDVQALWFRATALSNLGRNEEAQADFERVAELDPDYSEEWPECVECD